jgi:hypothetical protein
MITRERVIKKNLALTSNLKMMTGKGVVGKENLKL